jgi:hypothetical protein
MTTPSTERKAGPLLGTGSQTSWPFTFKVFAKSDIAVTIADSLGVETALVLDTDYSVTLNANQETSPGGTVTYPISGDPLPTGSRLVIVGNLPYDQPLDLPSGGNFSPLALENELDRLTMQIQQLREQVGRSLQVSVTTDASVTLPAPSANELIGWDSTGSTLQNFAVSDLATAVAYATMHYDTFNGDGVTTQFTLTADPAVLPNLDVAISGVVQVPGTDYTLLNGVLVFTSAPANGTVILARYGEGLTNFEGDSSDIRFLQAGTGAVQRTAQAKMREVQVSVTDYGADPTGAADSTSAIQDAIDYVGGSGGGVVYFPTGDYKITTVYVQHERVTLLGQGDSSIIINSLTANGIEVGTSAAITSLVVIDGLRFDRATKSTNGAAVKMIRTGYSTVKNCVFKNSRFGVEVKTHNDSLTIQNNTFLEGTYFGVLEYNANETWANDLTIRGNFFWHVEEAAVYMGADGVGVASVGDTYIEDNVIVGSPAFGPLQTQYAIKIEGAGSYNTNISISRNTFEGVALQTLYLADLSRCRVEGNYFSGTGANDVGLYWDGGVGNSIISGNIFVGYNNQAAKFISTGGLTVTGNNFTSNVTLAGNIAELEFTNCVDVQVTGNYFYSSSSQYAIEFIDSGGSSNNLTVTGNRFAKFSGNANYLFDISWQAFAANRRFADNLGNDFTSGAGVATPSAGNAAQWYAGDTIRNTSPSVLGTAGSRYVISGWVCTAQGDPGTWHEQRTLTGT